MRHCPAHDRTFAQFVEQLLVRFPLVNEKVMNAGYVPEDLVQSI
jgi:hypothetical protein